MLPYSRILVLLCVGSWPCIVNYLFFFQSSCLIRSRFGCLNQICTACAAVRDRLRERHLIICRNLYLAFRRRNDAVYS